MSRTQKVSGSEKGKKAVMDGRTDDLTDANRNRRGASRRVLLLLVEGDGLADEIGKGNDFCFTVASQVIGRFVEEFDERFSGLFVAEVFPPVRDQHGQLRRVHRAKEVAE